MIWKGAFSLAAQAIGLFGEAGKAKRDSLKALSENFQRTWVDEIIVLYWFGPSVLAWFGYPDALAQLSGMDEGLRDIQIGISAAVFGLNKLAGKK